MKLSEFLLNSENEYNGHKQTEIGDISFKSLRAVVAELEEADPYHSFKIELFSDGSGSAEQACYWREGEHPNGHKDRTIFGFQLKGED